MANVTITLIVPEERVAAAYAAAAGPVEPTKSVAPAGGGVAWYELAPQAVLATMGLERALLRRLTYARGQRVPLAELVKDFGLPSQGSLEHDFPRLKAFCDADPASRRFPVVAGGDGTPSVRRNGTERRTATANCGAKAIESAATASRIRPLASVSSCICSL